MKRVKLQQADVQLYLNIFFTNHHSQWDVLQFSDQVFPVTYKFTFWIHTPY